MYYSPMNRQQLIDLLLEALQKADADHSDTVTIWREDASELVEFLHGVREVKNPPVERPGRLQFYCIGCGKSFWAAPQEDRDCFERWHYHRWLAKCPYCHEEVTQNDRYWR